MYAGASRFALGAIGAASLPPIESLSPSPVPAGPGQEVVTIRGSGLRQGYNLAIYPVDYGALTNPSTQGYSAPLYGVSVDGTTAKALIDLRGNVAAWMAQIVSPYTNEESAPFAFSSIAGAGQSFDQLQYFFESGQLTPVLAIASTQLIPSRDAAGNITNHIVVTGATASIPYPAATRSLPGPGVLVNDPGAWRFVPAGPEARQIVESRFGADVVQVNGCSDGQVDVFGLPIVTPTCPGNLAWTDAAGSPVTSPWSTSAATAPGTIIGFHPVTATPAPIATTAPTVQPALYQPPNAPPPSPGTAPATIAPPAPTTLYQPPASVPASSTPTTQPNVSIDLYQSPASSAPTPAPIAAPIDAPASRGGLGLLLLIVGGGAWLLSSRKHGGTKTWQ